MPPDLATFPVGNISSVAVVVGHTDTLHTELGLKTARPVVNTSVQDSTVVACLVLGWGDGGEGGGGEVGRWGGGEVVKGGGRSGSGEVGR